MPTYENFPTTPSPETPIGKQEVIDIYKKFIEKGITNPDDMDLSDPEVIEANTKYDKYFEQLNERAKGNKEAELRANFEQTIFYIEAGFTDPVYVEEVAFDHMRQDIDNAREEFPQLADEIEAKAREYHKKYIPEQTYPEDIERKEV